MPRHPVEPTSPKQLWYAIWAATREQIGPYLEIRDYETQEQILDDIRSHEVPEHALIIQGASYELMIKRTYLLVADEVSND